MAGLAAAGVEHELAVGDVRLACRNGLEAGDLHVGRGQDPARDRRQGDERDQRGHYAPPPPPRKKERRARCPPSASPAGFVPALLLLDAVGLVAAAAVLGDGLERRREAFLALRVRRRGPDISRPVVEALAEAGLILPDLRRGGG